MGFSIRSFAAELKRRKVYQVGVVYGVVAFGVWQAADLAFPYLGLPDEAVTFVLVVTALGFPLALVLAWAYELRPQDVIDRDAGDAVTGVTGGRDPAAAVARDDPAGAPDRAALDGAAPDGAAPDAAPGAAPDLAGLAPGDRSIAVLPFADMGGEADSSYFADGVVEELINALAQVRGLRVVARTSAFGFRDTTADVREIGRALNVAYVVEGSVRRASGRLRITAQLIDAGDGYHLWSERYERPLGDVFEIQDGIVEAVTESLLSRLPAATEERTLARTDNAVVYDLYLRARSASVGLTPDGLRRARDLHERALERDPAFALAHVGLAEVLVIMATGFATEPPRVIMIRAHEAAERALALAPDLPEAHLVRGLVLFFHEWSFAAARQELERAIELSPSFFNAWFWIEFYHTYVSGDYDAAVAAQRQAAQLNPLDPAPRLRLGWVHHIFGHQADALAVFRQLHDDGQIPHLARLGLSSVHAGLGHTDEAVRWGRECLAVPQPPNNALGMVGALLALAGHVEEGRAALRELEARSAEGAAVEFWIAAVLAGLGRAEEAFHHLQRALQERDPTLIYLSVVPRSVGLHGDPRYAEILCGMGLGHLVEAPQDRRPVPT